MGTALQGGGLDGLAPATCLPRGSALDAEAKRYVDWGRCARNAALRRRRREHGYARRSGTVKVSPQRRHA
jgi:hypothetical protein